MLQLTGLQSRAFRLVYGLSLAWKAAQRGGSIGDIFEAIGRRNHYTWTDLSEYANQAREFTNNPWVNIAVGRIANTASLVHFDVYRLNQEQKEPQVNHPLEQLLRRPNSLMSQKELLESTLTSYLTNGNAYWLLNGGAPGGAPDEIYTLRPDRMRIVAGTSRANPVGGYVYELDEVRVPLEVEEVVHFKRVHPLDDYYGLSPLQSAQYAIQSDNKMAEWNRNFFGIYNAVPAGILNIKQPVTPKQYASIKQEWYEAYGGTNRRTAVLQSAEMEYQPTGLAHKDMDFLAGRDYERKIIFEVYGVPLALYETHTSLDNVRTQMDSFINDTIWPLMVSLADRLTVTMCPFWGDDLIVEPEDIRKSESDRILQEIQAYSSVLSINEISQKYQGLQPVSWGEVPPSGAGAAVATATLPLSKNTGVSVEQLQAGGAGPQDTGPASLQTPARVAAHLMEGTNTNRPQTIIPKDLRKQVPGNTSTGLKVWTRAQQRELEQFARYAGKGKDIEAFTFLKLDAEEALAIKAFAEVVEAAELAALAPVSAVKAYTSISGISDPLGDLKARQEKRLRSDVAQYLQKLLEELSHHSGHVGEGTRGDSFWTHLKLDLAAYLASIYAQILQEEADEMDDWTSMSLGLTFDPAGIVEDVQAQALLAANRAADQIITTTRNGVSAILTRLAATGLAIGQSLANLLAASPLFTGARAALIAATEITGLSAIATSLAARAIAAQSNGNVVADKQLARGSQYIPAHVNCRCFWTIQHDGGRLTLTYNTVQDERVCPICEPNDGLTLEQLGHGH